MVYHRSVLIGFALVVCATAIPAYADPDSENNVVQIVTHVSYADLDLSTSAGQKSLRRRLASAVSSVCPATGSRDLTALMFEMQCRREARRTTGIAVARVLDTARKSEVAMNDRSASVITRPR